MLGNKKYLYFVFLSIKYVYISFYNHSQKFSRWGFLKPILKFSPIDIENYIKRVQISKSCKLMLTFMLTTTKF